MSQDEFLLEFEELLEMPAGSLKDDSRLEDLERWDSVAMISLLALVEEKCGVQLSPRKVAGCSTVKDLHQLTQPA